MQLLIIVFTVAAASTAAQLKPNQGLAFKLNPNLGQNLSRNLNQNFQQDSGSDVIQQQRSVFRSEEPAVIVFSQNIKQDLAGDHEHSNELNDVQQAEKVSRLQRGRHLETVSVEQKGSYEYTGEDGNTYRIEYTAHEGGLKPKKDQVPSPPPKIYEYQKLKRENPEQFWKRLRREHPELFWAENGESGNNHKHVGRQGKESF